MDSNGLRVFILVGNYDGLFDSLLAASKHQTVKRKCIHLFYIILSHLSFQSFSIKTYLTLLLPALGGISLLIVYQVTIPGRNRVQKAIKSRSSKAIVKMFTLFLPALFRISPLILYHVTTPHGNIFSLYCHYLKEIKQIQICQRSLDLFINISERICNRYSIHFKQC